MLSLVSCEPTGSSFSTPGFAPDSGSPAIALHRTHSGRIAHSFNETSFTVSLHHTLSLSPPIAVLRLGPWVRVPADSLLHPLVLVAPLLHDQDRTGSEPRQVLRGPAPDVTEDTGVAHESDHQQIEAAVLHKLHDRFHHVPR